MKLIFMGTPQPAAELLEQLTMTEHELLLVVTQPDRPKGRGRQLSAAPVKQMALDHGLSLKQPEKVRGNGLFTSQIKDLQPDVIVVVAYGQILPAELIEVPKYGCINVHASLLPKYRGAAPIQWALLNGEKETGLTIMKINERLDAGEIILQQRVGISETDDAISLSKKLFDKAPELLLKALQQIETGQAKYLQQAEGRATNAPSISKESGEIDWRKSAQQIHDRIRALVPWPVAHTFFREKRLKIWRSAVHVADLETRFKEPGTVVALVKGEGFIVATGQGHLLIREVQLADKKRMPAHVFVHGHDVRIGETLPN
ncbi:MAG: methionyl-tRNA formyltransferase [Candidatus Saganbacteria bacterium]|nr:methionyl-tRNA formyltransferase [Candidatus Saganbacteria bacterium]